MTQNGTNPHDHEMPVILTPYQPIPTYLHLYPRSHPHCDGDYIVAAPGPKAWRGLLFVPGMIVGIELGSDKTVTDYAFVHHCDVEPDRPLYVFRRLG